MACDIDLNAALLLHAGEFPGVGLNGLRHLPTDTQNLRRAVLEAGDDAFHLFLPLQPGRLLGHLSCRQFFRLAPADLEHFECTGKSAHLVLVIQVGDRDIQLPAGQAPPCAQ